MLTLDYTQSILNLQEVIVKKVTTTNKSAVIDIEMSNKRQKSDKTKHTFVK